MMVHSEVTLASAYAIFLLAAAGGLRCFARHTGRASGSSTSWPRWEAIEFQNRIALLLQFLAGVILVLAAIRHHDGKELSLLSAIAVAVLLMVSRQRNRLAP